MDHAKITVSRKRSIDHEDADAAGFEDGYAWTCTTALGIVESASATREDAIADARLVAVGHGYADEQIDLP